MLNKIFQVLAHWNNNLRVDMSLHLDTLSWFRANQSLLLGQKKICVLTVTCQKNLGSVGRDYYYYFFIIIIGKTGNSRSGIRFRYFIFEIFGKPSFIEAVLWRIMQFFYLLCSQFRQKASSWINKTLLLVKHQKWLSEFCVKIHRVASKN